MLLLLLLFRLAANAQNLMKNEHPCTLYVGSLRYDIQEDMLKRIFEPFGHVLKMEIHRDEQGKSKGYGFVQVGGVGGAVTQVLGV